MPSGFGEVEISDLCKRFRLPTLRDINGFRDFLKSGGDTSSDDLRPLMNCAKMIPCSTAECEQGFSEMNLVITPVRTKLLVERVSALMFINLHGPPLKQWDPTPYVTTWLRCHRSAESRGREWQPIPVKINLTHCGDSYDRYINGKLHDFFPHCSAVCSGHN